METIMVYWGNIRKMANNMETSILDYVGFRVQNRRPLNESLPRLRVECFVEQKRDTLGKSGSWVDCDTSGHNSLRSCLRTCRKFFKAQ